MKLSDKLKSLDYCFSQGDYEDCAGHLCDLLELCRQNIRTHDSMMFADLVAMVRTYGRHPEAPEVESE